MPIARQKNLELILDIDPRVADRILGDMIRLRQVMLNLLNNAVKVYLLACINYYTFINIVWYFQFTEVGHIIVSLTSEEIEGSEDHVFYFTITVCFPAISFVFVIVPFVMFLCFSCRVLIFIKRTLDVVCRQRAKENFFRCFLKLTSPQHEG
jgi:hypothetical protein